MRLDSPKVKRAAGWIGAFALPVAIVQIAGWMSGSSGPSPAQAVHSPNAHALSISNGALRKDQANERSPRRFSPHELAAAERIEWLRAHPFGPTPMLHAAPQPSATPVQIKETIDPTEEKPIVAEPAPDLHLQALLSGTGATAPRALINGRLIALGERIPGTDWILAAINADERQVILEHAPTNRAVALTLPTP